MSAKVTSILIYLFIQHIPYSVTAGSARNNAKKRDKKERRRKNVSGRRVKPSTPTQAIDARMGGEEKTENKRIVKKRRKKKRVDEFKKRKRQRESLNAPRSLFSLLKGGTGVEVGEEVTGVDNPLSTPPYFCRTECFTS